MHAAIKCTSIKFIGKSESKSIFIGPLFPHNIGYIGAHSTHMFSQLQWNGKRQKKNSNGMEKDRKITSIYHYPQNFYMHTQNFPHINMQVTH